MFRSKKKRDANTVRKRRDVDEDEQSEKIEVNDVDLVRNGVNDKETDTKEHVDSDVDVLERMRVQMQRSKSKFGAVSFSSKASSSSTKRKRVFVDGLDEHEEGVEQEQRNAGVLSFDDGTTHNANKQFKRSQLKIRPNLHVSHSINEDKEEISSMYSSDMLAALIREQNVMRPSFHQDSKEIDGENINEGETIATPPEDDIMGEAQQEETEFIPLDAKLAWEKKKKQRVTFGMQDTNIHLPKTTEVVESDGDEDGEDDEQSSRWEEELMRRGGFHNTRQSASQTFDQDKTEHAMYPTRNRVVRVSLNEMLLSMQRRVDSIQVENDRVSRELSRFEAETTLTESKLNEQRQDHANYSEQYEYFQEMEDFVKGLGFCLREKLPLIEAKESSIVSELNKASTIEQKKRQRNIQDEVRFCLAGSLIGKDHFIGLNSVNTDHSTADNDENPLISSSSLEKDAAFDVFADAVDELTSIDSVYKRFQEWKVRFPEVYKSAYCDLALIKLLSPYVRAELLWWDPLRAAETDSRSCEAATKRVRSITDMAWFQSLYQQASSNVDHTTLLDDLVLSILRDVVVDRVASAVSSRFDPFSAVHMQSTLLFLESFARYNSAWKFCEQAITGIVESIVHKIRIGAKSLPLLALTPEEAAVERTNLFARQLIAQFSILLENVLALFVSLPPISPNLHDQAFQCMMQVLHQLLAYLNHCRRLAKAELIHEATSTVKQLQTSSFMQRILARSTREQVEFEHLLGLYKPFL